MFVTNKTKDTRGFGIYDSMVDPVGIWIQIERKFLVVCGVGQYRRILCH